MSRQLRDFEDWTELTVGVVLGIIFEWLVIAVSLAATYDPMADDGGGSPIGLIAAFAALPALFGLLLLFPRTRRAGTALLIGFAIGSITGAGICAGWFASAR